MWIRRDHLLMPESIDDEIEVHFSMKPEVFYFFHLTWDGVGPPISWTPMKELVVDWYSSGSLGLSCRGIG